MEREPLIVLGLGFRPAATPASLAAAAEAAAGADLTAVDRIATAADKVGHPALLAFAAALGRPVVAVSAAVIAASADAAERPSVPARYGRRSVAEAAALAAAGPGSRLAGPRATAPDGLAVAVLAMGKPLT